MQTMKRITFSRKISNVNLTDALWITLSVLLSFFSSFGALSFSVHLSLSIFLFFAFLFCSLYYDGLFFPGLTTWVTWCSIIGVKLDWLTRFPPPSPHSGPDPIILCNHMTKYSPYAQQLELNSLIKIEH